MDQATAERTAAVGQEAYACGCGSWHHRNRRRHKNRQRRRDAYRWGDWTSVSPGWAAGVSAFDALRGWRP